MSNEIMIVTTSSGMIIKTHNKEIAHGFYNDGAIVEFTNGSLVFGDIKKYSAVPKLLFPVWLDEHEKNNLVAHWEKTGMFSTIISKIRSSESIKTTK